MSPVQTPGPRGFTLLELLAVLVLLSAVLATAVPALMKTGGIELRASARTLAAGLRRARSQAIQHSSREALSLDVERREFALSFEKRSRKLPGNINYTLYTARSTLESSERGAIRFFPDGGSTGGRITLSSGQRVIRVDVDWLSGRIRILDGREDEDKQVRAYPPPVTATAKPTDGVVYS
jgi:general secretion pathway protein H